MITFSKYAANEDGQILRFLVNHLQSVYEEIAPGSFKDYDVLDKDDFVNLLNEAINILKDE